MIFRTFHVDAQNLDSEFLRDLILNNVEASVMSNIIVGYSFDIKKNIPRVWSTSGHCVDTTAGYFFGKCPKFRPKWPKISKWYRLHEPKCCSVWVQLKKNNKKSFYMLELSPAIRVTRRNTFRPLESTYALHSGIWYTTKNQNFIWFFRVMLVQFFPLWWS